MGVYVIGLAVAAGPVLALASAVSGDMPGELFYVPAENASLMSRTRWPSCCGGRMACAVERNDAGEVDIVLADDDTALLRRSTTGSSADRGRR